MYYTASGIVTLKSVMIPETCSKHVEEYNKLIIKQEFVHSVGQLLRLRLQAYNINLRHYVKENDSTQTVDMLLSF